MTTYTVQDGDTWDSIAQDHEIETSWLMLGNALDPDASPAPDPPAAGANVTIPGDPPDHPIAPGNANALDLGSGGVDVLRLRLHDCLATPMTNVRYLVACGDAERTGTSADGWVTAAYPTGVCTIVRVEWGAPDDALPHPYAGDFSVDCDADDPLECASARLGNLGYIGDLAEAVARFQYDYGIDDDGLNDDGSLPDATRSALDSLFGGDCDATPAGPSDDQGSWTPDPVPTDADM